MSYMLCEGCLAEPPGVYCANCVRRNIANKARNKRIERRQRRYRPLLAPRELSKQNRVVDEVVRSLKTIDLDGNVQKPKYWSPRADS